MELTKDKIADAPQGATLRRLGGMFGAELADFDLRKLTPEGGKWVRELLREYKVVLLRDQHDVTPRDLVQFGSLLGELVDDPHHLHKQVGDEPSVKALVMDTDIATQIPVDSWHTDGAAHSDRGYLSILQAIDIPEYGRDTVFADMEAAYDHLSPAMQEFIDGLSALHSWGAAKPNAPDVERPVVLTDHKTGRKSLFVNQRYTLAIKGACFGNSRTRISVIRGQRFQ